MSDPSLPLQAEIIGRLKAYSTLTAIVGSRIHDQVPSGPQTFPYVALGECQVLPDKAQCVDGTETFLQIDAWSRAVGFPEVKRIAAAIVAALDDNETLNVAAYNVVVFELSSIQYLRDPDGITRHAALTFRALIDLA